MNPSAKWFYDWEVGAARDRRAMTHVFEVYVFYKRSVPSQSSRGYEQQSTLSGSRTLYNSVQVVAVATSTAFTLVSFRRAASQRGAAETRESSSARTDQQQHIQKQRSVPSKSNKAAPLQSSPGFVAGSSRDALYSTKLQRDERGENEPDETSYVYEDAGDTQQYKDDGEEQVRSGFTELLERLAIPNLYQPSTAMDAGNNSWYQVQADEAEEVEDTLSLVVVAAKNLAIVYWFLCRVPVDALLPFASGIQELLASTLSEHVCLTDAASLVGDRHLLEHVLHQLLDSTSTPPSYLSAAEDTHALVEISLTLALWLLFDKDNNDVMEAFLQRSATVLLDRDALLQSYQTWVEWLHERIDDFLYTHGWSLSRLLSGIIALVGASNGDAWSTGLTPPIRHHNQEQLHNLLTSDGDEWVAAGEEVFISHVRELYILKSRLSLSALHLQARARQEQSVELQSPVVASLVSSIGSSHFTQLSGVWLCQFESLSTHISRLEAPPALVLEQQHQEDAMDTLSFLWLLKQLTCVHLTFSFENSAPALLIRSVFNPRAADAGGENRCTRLVLDQQHHWFRCLPGGESSIATRIGGLSFGDYVGSVVRSPSSLSIVEVCCYAWPTASGSSSSQQFAYCWHWQLSLDLEQLVVNLTIERNGSPIWNIGASMFPPVDLSTEPLSRKLELVEQWTPVREFTASYRRLEEPR